MLVQKTVDGGGCWDLPTVSEEEEDGWFYPIDSLKAFLGTDYFDYLKSSYLLRMNDRLPEEVEEYHQKTGKYFRGTEKSSFLIKYLDTPNAVKIRDKDVLKHVWASRKELKKYLANNDDYEYIMDLFGLFANKIRTLKTDD